MQEEPRRGEPATTFKGPDTTDCHRRCASRRSCVSHDACCCMIQIHLPLCLSCTCWQSSSLATLPSLPSLIPSVSRIGLYVVQAGLK